ncbi:MAG: hypothetical protein ACI9VR_004512 [Cognaticolwellia sp.]|jgi:hypothetical protein
MPSLLWTMISLGCVGSFDRMEEWEQEAWLSTSSELIEADAVELRRLEDFLVPQTWYADNISAKLVSECLAGEDVRAYIPSTFAVMELHTDSINVGEVQATWLESGAAPSYDQSNGRIISLYEALLALRGQSRLLSGACFPPTEGRLLVVFPAEVPAALAWQALSTASDAGFDEIYLMVSDPAAELKAQTTPPRPPFKPGTQSIPERAKALDVDALARARAQLATGSLVSEQGRVCQESARLTFGAPSAVVTLERLDGSGQLVDQEAVLKTELGDALGDAMDTVWVAPQKESRMGDVVEVLSTLNEQGQSPAMQVLAAEEVDFLSWSGGNQVVEVDPYWSATATYDSRSSDQWVSLIPLEFARRNHGPCVDPRASE